MTAALTRADVAYIRTYFFSLEQLCAGRGDAPHEVRRLIAAGVLPAPAYVLDDGSEMFPADYFVLVDQAGGPDQLRAHFAARYRAVGGVDALLDEEWQGYLSGGYFVCLRHVVPETIVRKSELVASLTQLLEQAAPARGDWQARLRREVSELDGLEREFSPDYDRNRFGAPVSRDRLINGARRRYPELFTREVAA
jgi:hypothetical protein